MSEFTKAQFKTLFAYHFHVRRTMLDCANRISEQNYLADPGYGRGSLHSLMFHVIIASEKSWRIGLATGIRPQRENIEDYPSLAVIVSTFEQEKKVWLSVLDNLTPGEIEGQMNLTNLNGRNFLIPRWRILHHILFHGMQHHSEMAQLLTSYGQSPGDIDFIFFER